VKHDGGEVVAVGPRRGYQYTCRRNRPAVEGSHAIQTVIRTLSEHKAYDLVVLDLRQLSDATDYFVIASGSSDTHVRALADHVLAACHQEGRRPHHVEGLAGGRWVLIDFVDFVVHVFHPSLREFYQLERLWADAPAHSSGAHPR
jgi:ribosome-associated protein